MRRITLFLICLLGSLLGLSQNIKIGVLTDKMDAKSAPLLHQLENEIKAVIGENNTVEFLSALDNDFNVENAQLNYDAVVEQADIILAFGLINNLVLLQKENFEKPTLVFGAVNNDFIQLPENKSTSEVHNLSYLITPSSYTGDLDAFSAISNFNNVAIMLDEVVINKLPVANIFDNYFESKNVKYQLFTIENISDFETNASNFDAVYVAGGFHLSDQQFKNLVNAINTNKLPSFSAIGKTDVERGLLASNKPDSNIGQFFRRIALNVEAIISGINPSNLPLFIDVKENLTINYTTARAIDFPIRYSVLANADIIGGSEDQTSDASLSIIDIMNTVVSKNLSLEAERKSVELSGEDVNTAKSAFLPSLEAGASAIYIDPKVAEISNGSNPEFSTAGNLTFQQLIYNEGAKANVDIQKSLNEAQKETYNAAELDALLNASVAYFNALLLKTNVNIQNQNLQVTKQNLEIAEQNYEAGASGKGDVLRLKSQQAQNTQSLIDAGNDLRQAFNAINQLMNQPISTKIDVLDAEISSGVFKNYKYQELFNLLDDPKLQESLVAFLVEEAKKNAPELKSLDHNYDAIQRTYKLSDKGRFVPSIALQGQYNLEMSRSGLGSSFPSGFPIPPDGNYNVGLNVSIPIFNQNTNNINRQISQIQSDQLTIQKENLNLNIEKNVNDIVLDMVGRIANIEISKVALESAEESLELTQNAYQEGAVPVIQLIDAQTNFLQAQLAQATANYNYLLTSIQLERIIGYFFLSHSEQENNALMNRARQFILSKQ